MPRFALVLVGTLAALVATPNAPAVGAYVGIGPSYVWGESSCYQQTVIAPVPSPIPGKWAAEIECAYAWPYNTNTEFSAGRRSKAAYVAYELEGSPETGLTDSGNTRVYGTSPGRSVWALSFGPLGEDTAWSLDYVFYPDPDYLGTGPRPGYWRGNADFTGVSP